MTREECEYCYGSGVDEQDEMGKCRPCKGKGYVSIEDDLLAVLEG